MKMAQKYYTIPLTNNPILQQIPYNNDNISYLKQTQLLFPKNFPNIKINNSNIQTQTVIVNNIHEQQQLIDNLEWRIKSKAPIVKINQYFIETYNEIYPKKYRVVIQEIGTQIKNLSGIQLKNALYLIKTCILGLQTLVVNYHHLNPHNIFYGINVKKQCKVWLTNKLAHHIISIHDNYHSAIFIHFLLQNILAVSSIQCKNHLQIFVQEIKRCKNIGFDGTLRRLEQFAKKFKITIGNILEENQCNQLNNKDIKKKQRLQINKNILSNTKLHQSRNQPEKLKINFRYFSPTNSHMKSSIQSFQNNLTYKSCFVNSQKPKVRFCYNYNQINNIQSRTAITSFNDSYIKVQNSNQFMLNCQSNVKDKLKEQSPYHPKDQIQKQQDKKSLQMMNLDKNQRLNLQKIVNKLQISHKKLIQNRSLSKNKRRKRKTLVERTKNNFFSLKQYTDNNIVNAKNSVSTTHRSQINKNVGTQMQFDTNSKPFINQQEKSRKISPFEYNFGGLLPSTFQQSLKSHIIQSAESKSKDISPKNNFPNDQHKINLQNFKSTTKWNFKLTDLFSQNKSNLKESVHCGQDIIQPSNTKLDKLRHFGRQISSTICSDVQQN